MISTKRFTPSKQQMTMQKRNLYAPAYVKDFNCVGSECEEHCCGGWKVLLERETYEKYLDIEEPVNGTIMREHLLLRDEKNRIDRYYAEIVPLPNGNCPFLDSEGLCAIQKTYGEEYLSIACATFPRETGIVFQSFDRSLSISCPEAARRALLDPARMEFENIEEDERKPFSVERIIEKKGLGRFFNELQLFCIQLMQIRELTIEERLIFLGMFLNNLQKDLDEGQEGTALQLIENYITFLKEGNLKEQVDSIPSAVHIQVQLMKGLIAMRVQSALKESGFMKMTREIATSFAGDQFTAEEAAHNYLRAHRNHYIPFMQKHGYMMEHFLVNHIFTKGFPLCGKKRPFENFIELVIHYAMVKIYMSGLGSVHQELTTGLTLKIMQSISRAVDHNQAYVAQALETLRMNEFDNLAHMAILIKN